MANSGDDSSADRYELGAPLVDHSSKGTWKSEEHLVWHKVAAISGMAAVGLGAYGTHMLKPTNPTNKIVWETANLYHLVHTVALLAAPLTKRPRVFGGLLTFGLVAFSGSCYVAAFYENRSLSLPAPFWRVWIHRSLGVPAVLNVLQSPKERGASNTRKLIESLA